MKDILVRLEGLAKNLNKSGKPNAALVCSDAMDVIADLRSELESKSKTTSATDKVRSMLDAFSAKGYYE